MIKVLALDGYKYVMRSEVNKIRVLDIKKYTALVSRPHKAEYVIRELPDSSDCSCFLDSSIYNKIINDKKLVEIFDKLWEEAKQHG